MSNSNHVLESTAGVIIAGLMASASVTSNLDGKGQIAKDISNSSNISYESYIENRGDSSGNQSSK